MEIHLLRLLSWVLLVMKDSRLQFIPPPQVVPKKGFILLPFKQDRPGWHQSSVGVQYTESLPSLDSTSHISWHSYLSDMDRSEVLSPPSPVYHVDFWMHWHIPETLFNLGPTVPLPREWQPVQQNTIYSSWPPPAATHHQNSGVQPHTPFHYMPLLSPSNMCVCACMGVCVNVSPCAVLTYLCALLSL